MSTKSRKPPPLLRPNGTSARARLRIDKPRAKKRNSAFRLRTRRPVAAEEEDGSDDEDEASVDGGVWQTRNKVYFHCEVTRKNVMSLIASLDKAKRYVRTHCPREGKVQLFIHSEGGDAYAGLSAMSHVETSSVPVVCVADGFVASAATFILLAARERYALQHSYILMHQLSTSFWGKYSDLEDELQNAARLMQTIAQIYETKTSLRKKTIEKILKKELNFGVGQCVKNGIVDAVYDARMD